ncbi:ungal specific transcription factor [Seiridium cupressi]
MGKQATRFSMIQVGSRPCANCRDFRATCEYVQPRITIHREQQRSTQAFQAVENRVAELEAILRREGLGPHGEKRIQCEGEAPADSAPCGPPSPTAQRNLTGTVVEVLRDLSIQASGGYIGASSQISMGRMISSIVQARESTLSSCAEGGWEHLSPKSANTKAQVTGLELSQISPEIADTPRAEPVPQLLQSYIRHISTRWPIFQTPFIRLLHAERHTLLDAFFTSILHLIYAIGGRFLETAGETGDFGPEQHFDQALKSLDDVLRLHDIRSVQFLLLLSIYSLRAPRGSGAWTYTGLAMRTCIDLGMHRKTTKDISPLEHEMRRPFAISDRDIDIQLPLDVEESCEDVIVLERAKVTDSQAPRAPATESTSITGFKYICQLRQIESDIQQSIYRVDQCQPAIEAETERILKVLEQWKESMPRDASHAHPESPVVDGLDFYMVYYYKCLRILLHPAILSVELSNTKYLTKCAEACGGVCRTYKKLHQSVPVGFSVMALHSIFLAGLTLLYCAWASPKKVFNISTSNDMNACSIVLYIVAERWPGARKHRDLYESIKQVVLESIEEGKYEPRRAITSLGSDIRSGVRAINDIDGYEELTAYAMVTEMAGSPITSDAVTPQDRDSNCVADTPGTRLNPNMALPMDETQLGYLELHSSLNTMFATHSNDWMMP